MSHLPFGISYGIARHRYDGHGVRFLPRHRIRVEIASSWFSRFERNPQTDAANWMTDEREPVIAQQQIYHDAQYASHL